MSITATKAELRKAMLSYYRLTDGRDYNCGNNLLASIVPAIGVAAAEANKLAIRLKRIDPDFPKSWTPLPEGR